MATTTETLEDLIDTGNNGKLNMQQTRAANKINHTTALHACGNEYVEFTCKPIVICLCSQRHQWCLIAVNTKHPNGGSTDYAE